MTIQDIIDKKKRETIIYRQDIVSVTASPLWKPVPGIPQSWRHTCLCCGEILSDNTHQYDLIDSVFHKYMETHLYKHL